jgi:hypothetical protein
LIVAKGDPLYIEFRDAVSGMDRFLTGDYYAAIPSSADHRPRRIVSAWERGLRIADGDPFEPPPPPGEHDLIFKYGFSNPGWTPKRASVAAFANTSVRFRENAPFG